ncbi:PKD domain-containing protein [Streptomyces sp. ICC4]|uniref:PKD domain-containing protein n=1 Tax=Streptomyces sp. ICC4 TaxID=2099584 RepID=UPI000DC79BAE|nr:PKD domain-containing protein [Streptomyces sp. ICC4]AWZ09937.1 hypothetical protein DRB89_42525 [Streptomyces sp. ICC4]
MTSADVDFGDGTTAHSTDGRFSSYAYKQPGEYKVTLTLQDSKGAKSTATRTVKVDYAASGYMATEPFRLLDTRTTNTPLQGGYARIVNLPNTTSSVPDHVLSGGMASVVLNVTVTGSTEDTHLSVWPSGQPRPATSNVNVRAGGTSSNTVTVPVGADGKILAQLNSGWASLIVDFVGFYQPNIGERFSPITPARVADTRTAGGPLGGGQTRTVKVAPVPTRLPGRPSRPPRPPRQPSRHRNPVGCSLVSTGTAQADTGTAAAAGTAGTCAGAPPEAATCSAAARTSISRQNPARMA